MLMNLPDAQTVARWKASYQSNRQSLRPNRRTGAELLTYLKSSYPVMELTERRYGDAVTQNIIMNECFAEKLSAGKSPRPMTYRIERNGNGTRLYMNRDDVFRGFDIIVGIDLETGYFMVEGSGELYDELFLYRGLDERDLENFYLVAEYTECLNKR